MFDARIRPLIDPPLNRAGRMLASLGVTANAVTLVGLACGLAAAGAIACGQFGAALALVILSRVLDGLDGAVARATVKSDFGGYLDIVCDFAFYVAVPLGFALNNPAFLLPAALLIASFTLTGISFLAYAVLAAERGKKTTAHGQKSFFYSTGLAEGAETILVFILMCLFPASFPMIALLYAGLCVATVGQRTIAAWMDFGRTSRQHETEGAGT